MTRAEILGAIRAEPEYPGRMPFRERMRATLFPATWTREVCHVTKNAIAQRLMDVLHFETVWADAVLVAARIVQAGRDNNGRCYLCDGSGEPGVKECTALCEIGNALAALDATPTRDGPDGRARG